MTKRIGSGIMKNPGRAFKKMDFDFYTNYSKNHKVPIDEAIIFLSVHFKEIRNVGEWAKQMGYSRSHFSRKIKQHFDESPKILLRNAKLFTVVNACLKAPYCKAFVIAIETGFENEKSLGQFLSRNFGSTITEVRRLCKLYSSSGTGIPQARLSVILTEYLNGMQNQKDLSICLKKHKLRSEKTCKIKA